MNEIESNGSSARVISLRDTPVRSSPKPDAAESLTARVTVAPQFNTIAAPKPINEDAKTTGSNEDPLALAAEVLEEFIPEIEQTPNTRLRIDKDDETGRFIYYNVDNDSGEVVRQFPPENILKFLSYYRDPEGLILDDEI